MTTEAIALFRKFGLHASADALAYREAKTCRRFEQWEGAPGVRAGAPGAEPFGEIDAMLARVRELRGDRPFDEVRQAFNAAADRLEVLASKLSEACPARGVAASEQTYYCPECGVMEENWHLSSCSHPRSLVRRPDGVAVPEKAQPKPCKHLNSKCVYDSPDGEWERWQCSDCGERFKVEIPQ